MNRVAVFVTVKLFLQRSIPLRILSFQRCLTRTHDDESALPLRTHNNRR
jgi:hypothetical protein